MNPTSITLHQQGSRRLNVSGVLASQEMPASSGERGSGRLKKTLLHVGLLTMIAEVALCSSALAQGASGGNVQVPDDPLTMEGVSLSDQVDLPPTLESTRPEQNLQEGPKALSEPGGLVPLRQDESAPPNAADMKFVFSEMMIEGASALPQEDLMRLWPFKTGDEVSVSDVFMLANAITRAYSEAGYALSFAVVPEQDIASGRVRLRVIEGFIEKVDIVGPEAERLAGTAVLERIRQLASQILNSRPLRTADLERYVLLINDLPGVKVSVVLSPSPDTSGAAVLHVEVLEHDALSGNVAYNNFMVDLLGRDVVGATVNLNGLLTGSDQLSLSGWHSATSNAYWNVAGQASTGIGNEGLRVGISASHSQSKPDDALLKVLDYEGNTTTGQLWVSYPVIRSRSENLSVSASFGMTNATREILSTDLTRDRLRDLEVSATYDSVGASRAQNYIQLGYQRGLDVLNAEGNSRANGNLEYDVISLNAQRTQPLGNALQGVISGRVGLRGQASIGRGGLFSSIECALGGRRFGRVYDSGTLSGDECLLGFGELSWAGRVGDIGTELYGFGDGGYLWQKGLLEPGEAQERTASSGGLGARVQVTPRVSGILEAAWAIDPPKSVTSTDDFRVNFGLRANF